MSQVYDNRNERVKVHVTPEDKLEVFVGESNATSLSADLILDIPTAEDLMEGLRAGIEHVRAKKRSADGY